MTVDEFLNGVATWFAFGVILPAHLLVIIYGIWSPWWRTFLGVTIFAKWLSFAVAIDFLVARRVFGEFPGYGVAAVIVYGLLFLAFSATVVEVLIERRHPGPPMAWKKRKDRTMTNPETPITTETVPEIWFKRQRVFRSIFTTVLTVLPLVPQIIAIIQGQWQAEWLTGVAVQAVAINAALTGIIALPPINAFLTRFGLGSVPRSAVLEGRV